MSKRVAPPLARCRDYDPKLVNRIKQETRWNDERVVATLGWIQTHIDQALEWKNRKVTINLEEVGYAEKRLYASFARLFPPVSSGRRDNAPHTPFQREVVEALLKGYGLAPQPRIMNVRPTPESEKVSIVILA